MGPSTPGVEVRRSEVQGHTRLYSKPEASLGYMSPYLKKKKWWLGDPFLSVGEGIDLEETQVERLNKSQGVSLALTIENVQPPLGSVGM